MSNSFCTLRLSYITLMFLRMLHTHLYIYDGQGMRDK